MLHRAFSIAILLIVMWLSYLTIENGKHITHLQSALLALTTQSQHNITYQDQSTEKLDGLAEFINQQNLFEQRHQEAQAELARHKQKAVLTQTYGTLLRAEILQKEGSFEEAANMLKASKDSIWQAGDLYPSHKEALQGLMQPIDESAQAWQSGNPVSIQNIYQTIQSVLQAIAEG